MCLCLIPSASFCLNPPHPPPPYTPDAGKLVDGGLPADALAATFRQLNVKDKLALPVGTASSVVVTEEGQVGEDLFVNTKLQKVVRVDPTEQKVTDEDVAGVLPGYFFDSSVEPLRAAVSTEMDKQTRTLHPRATIASHEVYSKAGSLTIVTAATVLNMRNLWTGHRYATWSVKIDGASAATLTGSSHITTHYFENGNVQLGSDKTFDAKSISFASPAELGKAVASAIASAEDDVQIAMEEMFENMASETLKDIRRFLPYTGKKFEWNAAAHRMRNTLRQVK